LIVSYAPFTFDFCPQRCKTHQINKIPCVLLTETVTDYCYVNRQINVSLLLRNIKLLWTSFDLLTDRLMPSVTDRLLIMYGILLQHLFLCYSNCVQSIMGFYIWLGVNSFFVSELNNEYSLPNKYLKTVFKWLNITWQFASITS